jgi:hypothetical protein
VLAASTPGLSAEAKSRIADEIGLKPRMLFVTPRLALASVAILFVAILVLAQYAKPGQTLYSLKRGTQQVRVIVQPGFNQDDLNKLRAAEQIPQPEIKKSQSGSAKSESKDKQSETTKNSDSSKSSGSSNDNRNDSSDDRSGSSGRDDNSSGSNNSGSGPGGSHGN